MFSKRIVWPMVGFWLGSITFWRILKIINIIFFTVREKASGPEIF